MSVNGFPDYRVDNFHGHGCSLHYLRDEPRSYEKGPL